MLIIEFERNPICCFIIIWFYFEIDIPSIAINYPGEDVLSDYYYIFYIEIIADFHNSYKGILNL